MGNIESQMEPELVFLKLGGSLITDKHQTAVARFDVIKRLAGEISAVKQAYPNKSILLGHGSGSFGHVPAKKFATRDGIKDEKGWLGFVEVWRAALTLNRIVTDVLYDAAVPVMAFPPSTALLSSDHRVECWNTEPIHLAIQAGLVPLVYGDVVFDRVLSGTIFSTEDLFEYLAVELHPKRILLAGSEEGVWADFPKRQTLYSLITPSILPEILSNLGDSLATDVTGGMTSKVLQCLNLVKALPGLEIWIFSGSQPGIVERALLGEPVGTVIRTDVSG